jgi:hypothetical protein
LFDIPFRLFEVITLDFYSRIVSIASGNFGIELWKTAQHPHLIIVQLNIRSVLNVFFEIQGLSILEITAAIFGLKKEIGYNSFNRMADSRDVFRRAFEYPVDADRDVSTDVPNAAQPETDELSLAKFTRRLPHGAG